MNDDLLKAAWKSQSLPPAAFSVEELQRAANKLQRGIRLRNALEYAACLLVVLGFVRYMMLFPYPLLRLGSALVILGTLFVAWQLHARASSQAVPKELAGLAFQRRQLARQRDAARTVWLWYVAPVVPGAVLFRWAVETELDTTAPFVRGTAANLVIAAVFIAIILFNLYSARKLQRQIDMLPHDAPH